MTFMTEVESGDRARALTALRRELAQAIDAGPDPRDLVALSLRLERVLEQLDEVSAPNEENDELAAKRRAILSAASGA